MQDQAPAAFLSTLGLGDKPPTLASIFQAGARISDIHPASIPAGTPVQRIAVLGSVTIDYLARAIACGVIQEGVFPVVYQAPFGSYVQEVLEPASGMYRFAPELVVIASHWRDMIAPLSADASADAINACLLDRVGLLRSLWVRLAGDGIKIIQHRLVPPPHQYRGIADRLVPVSPANQIARLNEMLLEAGHGLMTWIDMEALAHGIGTRRFMAAKFFYAAKLDYDPKFLPDYLPLFRAAWRSATGRSKKVLVLDLDNTLWGGVIGDDGIDDIELGSGSPAGEAFEDWQRTIKALGDRGVVLAVCSKNDPEVAESGFTHPNTVLRRTDFAAFACSWDDKVTGLRRIATELNLALDSFVFCDDNPAECELVQRELPEVTTVCMGADPASFIDLFDAGHWFDTDTFTSEDLGRSAAYLARASALEHQRAAPDLRLYLASLAMKGSLKRPTDGEIARVAQLELKTNQFNLTTRRYNEAQIRGLLERHDAIVLVFRLADRFGDHGLTSTLIAFLEGDTMRIDSWLMSCRILSRSAEPFILLGLITLARTLGATWLSGEYLPTAKNGVVSDLYEKLGFMPQRGGIYRRPVGDSVDDLITHIDG